MLRPLHPRPHALQARLETRTNRGGPGVQSASESGENAYNSENANTEMYGGNGWAPIADITNATCSITVDGKINYVKDGSGNINANVPDQTIIASRIPWNLGAKLQLISLFDDEGAFMSLSSMIYGGGGLLNSRTLSNAIAYYTYMNQPGQAYNFANDLRAFGNASSNWGMVFTHAGMVCNLTSFAYELYSNDGHVGTGTVVGFVDQTVVWGASAVVTESGAALVTTGLEATGLITEASAAIGAAVLTGTLAPIVAGAAFVYGAAELYTYFTSGQSIEQKYFGK